MVCFKLSYKFYIDFKKIFRFKCFYWKNSTTNIQICHTWP